MIRAMFSSINALYTHQMYMDVVADNLANVNTNGFKSSYITFKDQFAQTRRVGAAPSDTLGGINPIQIGLGTQFGTVSPNFTQGALQNTGRDLDIALQGDGFFTYRSSSGEPVYSRDGALVLDSEAYLVNNATGERILGWMADPTKNFAIDTGKELSEIQIPVESSIAKATDNVYLVGNLDASKLAGDVDNKDERNVVCGIYDSLGQLQQVRLKFERQAQVAGNGPLWNVTEAAWVKSDGTETDLTASMTPAMPFAVQFGTNGQITGDLVLTLNDFDPLNGAGAHDVNFDLSGMTSLSADYTASVTAQDGLAAGALSGIEISSNTGIIYGVYTNGSQRAIGQFAITTFSNPAGLMRLGESRWRIGLNSGEARVGAAATGDRGTVSSGYSEGSNTDMSREFTNMILAQRGFQANSRVITTSDEMLQELVNLKR